MALLATGSWPDTGMRNSFQLLYKDLNHKVFVYYHNVCASVPPLGMSC